MRAVAIATALIGTMLIGQTTLSAEKQGEQGVTTPTRVTMNFSRDEYGPAACLEYSWVPTGIRHVIQLSPGQASGTDTLPIEGPSNVQIYRATNGGVGFDSWQIPPVKLTPPIVGAGVKIVEKVLPRQAIGVVYYQDGSIFIDTIPLKDPPLSCPEIPPPR